MAVNYPKNLITIYTMNVVAIIITAIALIVIKEFIIDFIIAVVVVIKKIIAFIKIITIIVM